MENSRINKLTPTAIGVASFVIILPSMRSAESFLNPLLMFQNTRKT